MLWFWLVFWITFIGVTLWFCAGGALEGFERLLGIFFEHEDIVKPGKGLYLRRFYVRRNTAEHGGLYVHHIYRSDDDRDPHDHPFRFRSLVLKGGYWEEEWRAAPGIWPWMPSKRWYGPGRVLTRPATWLHRLRLPTGKTCWTLVAIGRREREWGFATKDGWVPSSAYKDKGESAP
jgi:hypothetical protein